MDVGLAGASFGRYGIVRCVFGIGSDMRSREELVEIQPYKLLASSFSSIRRNLAELGHE